VTTVYARIEIDDASLVDMTPEGFAENLGEIIHRALEPLADVTVKTFVPVKGVVYARIEIDDASLVDMTPEGFAENLGEIVHRALEPLADVTVKTFVPVKGTNLAAHLDVLFEEPE
jgi:hypothetical protein